MDNFQQSRILIILCKNICGICVENGYSFFLNPTLNTCPKPHLQKVLPFTMIVENLQLVIDEAVEFVK